MKKSNSHMMLIVSLTMALILPDTEFYAESLEYLKDDIVIKSIMENDEYRGAVAVGIFDARCEEVWSVITDYAGSPEFMPHIAESRVMQRNGSSVIVKNSISTVLLSVEVTFEMTEDAPNMRLSWNQQSGSFRLNRGQWILENCGQGWTKATYFTEIDHPMLPNWAKKSLIDDSIPAMYKAVRGRLAAMQNKRR